MRESKRFLERECEIFLERKYKNLDRWEKRKKK